MKLLSAKDFQQYSFLSNLILSPNGKRYAFAVSKVKDGDGYATNLWLGDYGKEPFLLTSGEKDGFYLWEDDTTILFSSDRENKNIPEGTTQYYRISTQGGEAVKAFSLPIKAQWILKIGPNQFLMTAKEEMARTEYSLTSEKKQEEDSDWKADCHVIEELPFWSNGEGYIAGMRSRLFLYTQGDHPTLIPISPTTMDVGSVKYHEKSKMIYYSGQELEKIGTTFSSIFRCNLSGDEFQMISPDTTGFKAFDFYGDMIVTTASDQEQHGLNENPVLYLLDPSTKALTVLATPDRSLGSAVGTDSRMGGGTTFKVWEDFLYFTMLVDYSSHLCRIPLIGGEIETLSPVGDSFDFFDIGKQGILAGAFRGLQLAEIYEQRGGDWTQLTSFHDFVPKTFQLSQPEYHVFTDPNGFEIEGWVMPPTNYKKGESYPAILHIHGGPKTVLGGIYHHEMQLWAAKGYFVLYCNPRGSDGKGNAFADIRGKYGTCDYDNIMDFLDNTLSLYADIDTDRIGVTGGSYGGFMTNWIVGHTNRFKVAATQRSISNWLSKTYMSDIGYYFNVDQVLAEHWDSSNRDAERLWDSSPLKYAHNATTPTLIIHSDQDYRCPVPEGYQMFTALQLAGVETKMCVFHGETHELSRSGKPKNRLRRLNEISDWMDKFLKD